MDTEKPGSGKEKTWRRKLNAQEKVKEEAIESERRRDGEKSEEMNGNYYEGQAGGGR